MRQLIGRDRDIEMIRSFVDDATARGGALLLSGDAGVGKTALLAVAASHGTAIGARIVHATGAQFEANLSFAGLHQLLYPLLDHLSGLDELPRAALNSALGLAGGPPADRLLVSCATLALLAHAAGTAPVLVIVDDLPWLDQVSATVLGFVARRLAGHRVGFLACSRTGEEGFFDRSGIRTYDIEPLSDAASAALLASRYPELTPRARQRLLTDAQGNPLALLELPVALARAPQISPSTLPSTLPLTRRLQAVFADRVRDLPEWTFRVLLLAVLDGSGDLRILRAHTEVDDLAPAERAHLLSIDRATARLTFRHPLIRSAVFDMSNAAERRQAHAVLAERREDEPPRRAWHLAEACEGPNEQVAALLQDVAHTNLFRGDSVGAITELLHAADLSPAGTDRSRRLAEAAYLGAIVTGDLRDVPTLMDAARRADPQHGGALAGAVAGAYHLLNENGDVDSAHRLLTGAIQALPEPGDAHDKTLVEALYTLLMVAFFGGRAELWTPFHEAVDRLRPQPPQLLAILSRTFSDPAHLARPVLDRLDAAIARLGNETSPARIVRTAIAGSYLDRIGDCREPLWRAVRHGREGGAVTSSIEALFLLSNDAYFAGRWDELLALTEEGLALCETHNYRLLRWIGLFLRAMVATARGEEDSSRALTDQMVRWAAPRRVGAVTGYVSHVRTMTALSRGDFDDAYRQASAVSPAGQLATHAPEALWLIMELVEAAARSGRPADARAHATAVREAGIAELSPRLALGVAGAVAMAAPDEEHRELFERALRTPDADQWPFDLARIRLTFGERLRRTGSPAVAREHLRAALDGFEQLGARPWMTRAENELRAAGLHRDRAKPRPAETLTPQQHQIALLAASGLSNKQIGERLFLSPRTVGYHLHQIFPKLGVTSRAALRDALTDLPTAGDSDLPPSG
ncbi:AAA family ATPase [Micromonospora sp. NPDC005806]|uniref:AAA family ATPase n=1 Tax=Micromonospora sp. NPDC005806 TaxID=3364234 RepID=UPI0036A7F001